MFLQIPLDPLTNRYGSITKTSSGRSETRPVYLGYEARHEDDLGDDEEEEDEELDSFVNTINNKTQKGIERKLGMNYLGGTDSSRTDKASLVGNNGILEFSGDHTTTMSKGLSPRMSYRGKNTKGPALGAQGSATYIRNKPGRISGTQFGTSRPHKILTDLEDENIFNLSDMPDPMERSFIRQQNRVKKVLNFLKEYLNERDI